MSDASSLQHITGAGTRPRISVIMPACNAGRFLEEALASILRQTEGDFECLILDDGSTDDTYAVASAMADPRVRVFRNSATLGASASRNILLDAARGEFLALMDADDISLPDRFALQVAYLREHPEVWVCNGYLVQMREDGSPADRPVFTYPLEHETITSTLLFGCPVAHPFVMFRGGPWQAHGIRYLPEMSNAEDLELWHRLHLRHPECRFGCVDAVVGRYRVHKNSLSASPEKQRPMENRARLQTFLALGFSPDDPGIATHALLMAKTPARSAEDLAAVFDWAVRLRRANREANLFSPDIFDYLLSQRLMELADASPSLAAISGRLLAMWKKLLGERP